MGLSSDSILYGAFEVKKHTPYGIQKSAIFYFHRPQGHLNNAFHIRCMDFNWNYPVVTLREKKNAIIFREN